MALAVLNQYLLLFERNMDWIKANCAVGSTVWLFAAEGREGFYEKFGFEKRPMDGYGAGMQWFWRGHGHA